MSVVVDMGLLFRLVDQSLLACADAPLTGG